MKRIRHIFLTATLLFEMAASSQAQIFFTDEDMTFRSSEGEVLVNPQFAQGYDCYTPLSDGLILLAAFGGAYLLRKNSGDIFHILNKKF